MIRPNERHTKNMTPFAPGRRWLCTPEGRARFWFVILGPSDNYAGKPSAVHKLCRLEVHPNDLAARLPGYKSDGTEGTYSHKHLKKWAVLEEVWQCRSYKCAVTCARK